MREVGERAWCLMSAKVHLLHFTVESDGTRCRVVENDLGMGIWRDGISTNLVSHKRKKFFFRLDGMGWDGIGCGENGLALSGFVFSPAISMDVVRSVACLLLQISFLDFRFAFVSNSAICLR